MVASTLIWFALTGILGALAADGQTQDGWQGSPLSMRFGPGDLHALPHVLSVIGDAHGWIYAANVEGVLRFDGHDWQRIRLPGDASARTLTIDGSGRLLIGGVDNFGVLEPDASGTLVYRELRGELPMPAWATDIGTVWLTLALPEGVYLHTDAGLFLFADDGAHRHWPLPEGLRSFYSDGRSLLARIAGRGLVYIRDGMPVDIRGAERFADQIVAGLALHGQRTVVVAHDGIHVLENDAIRRLGPAPWRDEAGESPYEVAALGDGGFVVGTLLGSLYRFTADGVAVSQTRLAGGAAMSMHRDRDGGVWIGSEQGIERLSVELPWSYFGPENGVSGWIYGAEWHQEALWLAGSRGLSKMQLAGGTPTATRMPHIAMEAFDLLADGQRLLVAHRNGLLELSGADQWRELLTEEESISGIHPAPGRDDRAWAIGEEALHLLGRGPTGWHLVGSHDLQPLVPWGAESVEPGELWMGDSRGAPQRWRVDLSTGEVFERSTLGESFGFRLANGHGSIINQIDGVVHAVTGRDVYAWRGSGWTKTDGLPFSLFERPMDVLLTPADDGLYAYDTETIWRRAKGETEWRPVRFDTPQGRGVSIVQQGRDGKLRVASWLGLLQREYVSQTPMLPSAQVTLLSALQMPIDTGQLSRSLRLSGTREDPIRVLLDGEVRLNFGLLSIDQGQQFRFRITAEKREGAWTEWADDRSLTLRTGAPGNYIVDIEGRTRSAREVLPVRVYLLAPTPWYQAGWVRASTLLVALSLATLIVNLLISWRTRRLATANALLEQHIAERTAQLENANRKLEELATEDALTGVLNRRALDTGLQREWLRAKDRRLPLAVCMIDVDHFKAFNDTHGHLEGDRMLRVIAQFLAENHDSDRELLARFGGEEFALILPGHDPAAATSRARALHATARGQGWPVTLSIGVASHMPGAGMSPESLIGEADAALYRAKREGRDRIVVAGD
ncbi:MAG: diguanylate cyclase [Xanthomonadaceae bacterium]|nr:diguanylate cyclase [Xanthomonadaceae bacterium]